MIHLNGVVRELPNILFTIYNGWGLGTWRDGSSAERTGAKALVDLAVASY